MTHIQEPGMNVYERKYSSIVSFQRFAFIRVHSRLTHCGEAITIAI
jgi:hypothetical protein